MRRIKRIGCMLLTVAMLLAVVGCGGSSSGGTDKKEGDKEADVIEIVSWWDETPTAGTTEGDIMFKRLKDVEKKHNVKFKFTVLSADDITTQFVAAVMSGETLGDFVNMRHYWAFPEYVKKGFLLDMSEYLDFTDEAFTADDTKLATYDDGVYGFSMNQLRVGYVVCYNKAIFDKYGIADPHSMYENKTWTWDAVFDIAKKLTKTDSSGKTTLWGINPLDSYDMVETMIASNGGSYMEYVNGKANSTLTSSAVIKAIERARSAANTLKICDKYDSNADWDYQAKAFINGQYAMMICGSDNFDDFKLQMEDEYGVMPLPLGEGQTDYVNYIRERHFKVAASTSNKERIKKLLPILYEYYYPIENYDEIAKTDFEIYTWDADSVNVCLDSRKSQYVPKFLDFSSSYWDIVVEQGVNKALSGEMTATAAMKAVDDAWQAAIS